eukprot:9497003-Pyramimonas_sp.AAC.1
MPDIRDPKLVRSRSGCQRTFNGSSTAHGVSTDRGVNATTCGCIGPFGRFYTPSTYLQHPGVNGPSTQ